MNKYDFDFKRIEDVLHDVLGIENPTDIMSLKLQIRENLNALNGAIDRKAAIVSPDNPEKANTQKMVLGRELEEVAKEKSLEKILRKCVTIRYLTLLSLDVKIRHTDTYEEKLQKTQRRNEIFAVSDLVRSAPSILELIEQRKRTLRYIDSKNRFVQYNREPAKRNSKASQSDYPLSKIDIKFIRKPKSPIGQYARVLEDAGIYVYRFGDLSLSDFPNDEGEYTRTFERKNLVGVIKKDEFGVLRKYSVLMDPIPTDMPPEFCRDVLFSDMLLRNAKNNLGFLASYDKDPNDRIYGYKINFNGLGLVGLLNAITLENDPDKVQLNSNFKRVRCINDVYQLMQEKMEQTLNELFEQNNTTISENKEFGDD